MDEEEAQGRDDGIHRRHPEADLLLRDLETAQVVDGRRVGRAPQERRQTPDITKVVALCLTREPTQGHVVDEALAQRAHGSGGNGKDGSTRMKGATIVRPGRATLNQRRALVSIRKPRSCHQSRASGFVRSTQIGRRADGQLPTQARRSNGSGPGPKADIYSAVSRTRACLRVDIQLVFVQGLGMPKHKPSGRSTTPIGCGRISGTATFMSTGISTVAFWPPRQASTSASTAGTGVRSP